MSGLRISEDLGKFINPSLIPFQGHEELQGIMDPILGLHTGNSWSLDHEKEIVGAGAAVAAILATIFSGGSAAPAIAGAAEGAGAGATAGGAAAAAEGAGSGLLGGLGAGAAGEAVGSLAPSAVTSAELSGLLGGLGAGAADEAIGSLAGAGMTNDAALASLFSPSANSAWSASVNSVGGPGAGFADEIGSAAPPTWMDNVKTMYGNYQYGGTGDKVSKALKFANTAQKAMQQQQAPLQAPRAPRIQQPQPLSMDSFWTSEEDKKRKLMGLLNGGYYG